VRRVNTLKKLYVNIIHETKRRYINKQTSKISPIAQLYKFSFTLLMLLFNNNYQLVAKFKRSPIWLHVVHFTYLSLLNWLSTNRLSLSVSLTLAPFSKSRRQIEACPFHAANSKALRPCYTKCTVLRLIQS